MTDNKKQTLRESSDAFDFEEGEFGDADAIEIECPKCGEVIEVDLSEAI